ncbi:MAG: LysR family transcriptional regulator [Pseudomonadota bacterium]
MDRFEEMRTFAAVADHGVNGAARRLHTAPSAVSRRVRDLEARLGTALFARTGRRMALTDAGADYLAAAARILDEVEDAEARAGDAGRSLSGAIRMAAPLSYGVSHVMPALSRFLAAHPGVTLDLDCDDRRVDVQREGFDLAIRLGALADSALLARRLTAVPMVVAAAPAFLAGRKLPETLADLSGWPALTYAANDREGVWRASDAEGRTHSVTLSVRVVANNGDALRQGAEAGLGVVREPRFIVEEALSAGRLVPILTGYSSPAVDVFALWPARAYQPRRVRALIDHLVAALR